MTSFLLNGEVTIPVDFVSLHTPWPGSGGPPTGLTVGNIRLLNGSNAWKWSQLETSAGVYSWAALDALITAYRAQGWTVTFTVYGTPTFYVSAGDLTHNDMYGVAGGAAYPTLDTGLAGLSAFITALVTRYNAPAGAWRVANPTLGKGIATIEAWNEPGFTQNYSGYWWGSAPQLVDVCKKIYDAAHAVDPAIVVTSPAFFNFTYAVQFVRAVGTAVTGAQTYDAISFHGYLSMPYGYTYAGWPYDMAWGVYGVYPMLQIIRELSPGKDLYMSEYGFDTSVTTSLASFLAESANLRFTVLTRIMLICAAMGCKRFGCYSYNSTLCGRLDTDTNGVMAAINLLASVAGKTIIAADGMIRGSLTVSFSDGSAVTV